MASRINWYASRVSLAISLNFASAFQWWYPLLSFLSSKRTSRDNLRWLKPVSTLEKNVLIRRIDTKTLYHLTAMLWYHIKHQLLLKNLPWQQESPAKTHFSLALADHISKMNLVTPIFYF